MTAPRAEFGLVPNRGPGNLVTKKARLRSCGAKGVRPVDKTNTACHSLKQSHFRSSDTLLQQGKAEREPFSASSDLVAFRPD
jgi:hypothetical protein